MILAFILLVLTVIGALYVFGLFMEFHSLPFPWIKFRNWRATKH